LFTVLIERLIILLDILLATTPSPSEGWQHTTAALETPEMAQHKFIDKYDLPDAG